MSLILATQYSERNKAKRMKRMCYVFQLFILVSSFFCEQRNSEIDFFISKQNENENYLFVEQNNQMIYLRF